jgi:hypothetical protein
MSGTMLTNGTFVCFWGNPDIRHWLAPVGSNVVDPQRTFKSDTNAVEHAAATLIKSSVAEIVGFKNVPFLTRHRESLMEKCEGVGRR